MSRQLNNEGIELGKSWDYSGALNKHRAAVEINPFNPVFRRNLLLCYAAWASGVKASKSWEKSCADIRPTRKPLGRSTTKRHRWTASRRLQALTQRWKSHRAALKLEIVPDLKVAESIIDLRLSVVHTPTNVTQLTAPC